MMKAGLVWITICRMHIVRVVLVISMGAPLRKPESRRDNEWSPDRITIQRKWKNR